MFNVFAENVRGFGGKGWGFLGEWEDAICLYNIFCI